MKKHMFIQGDIGIGKSTIIKNAILDYIDEIGGFFTQRIFIGQRYVGFSLNNVTDKEKYTMNRYVKDLNEVNNVFLYCDKDDKWNINEDVFQNYAINYLKEKASEKKLILFDELGGVELKCVPFMNEIMRVLDDTIPVIGVLKSKKGINKLQTSLDDGKEIVDSPDSFYNRIKNHNEVEIVYIDKENYNESKEKVKAFINETFR